MVRVRVVGVVRVRVFLLLVLAGLPALWPLAAAANMANPYQPGQAVGEPLGDLASVAIMGELLQFDLRPLANDGPALVTAVYEVRQDGPEQQVQLEFVAAAFTATADTGVWFDGQPVPFASGDTENLPATWQPPSATPSLDGGEPLRYSARPTGTIRFTLDLTPGMHKIRVQYLARPSAYSGGSPARYWQLGYVLAPAREWKSFGGLTVGVLVPAGWRVATDPPLHRDNANTGHPTSAQAPADTLNRIFTQLPADTFELTAQYPVGDPSSRHPVLILLATLLLTVLGAGAVGSWLGAHRRRSLWALPLLLLAGIGWVLADAYALTPVTPSVPDGQAAWTYGYGAGRAAFSLSPLFFIVGVVATALLVIVSSRIAGRRGSAGPSA